jgi:hypothetical protein
VAEVYERAYGAPLFDDLRQPPPRVHASLDTIRRARAAQLMLYICAVDLIGREHPLAWMGGYSLGYGGVFVIAGMLSLDDLLFHVLPIIRPYAEDNCGAGTRPICARSSSMHRASLGSTTTQRPSSLEDIHPSG